MSNDDTPSLADLEDENKAQVAQAFRLLDALAGKTIANATATVNGTGPFDDVTGIQLAFADGTHLLVKAYGWGWECDGAGVLLTDNLNEEGWFHE